MDKVLLDLSWRSTHRGDPPAIATLDLEPRAIDTGANSSDRSSSRGDIDPRAIDLEQAGATSILEAGKPPHP